MIQSSYDVTPEELFRLITAYTSIRKPEIRAEFLRSIEVWSTEQWLDEGR